MASVLDGVDQRTRLAGHNRLELLLFRLNGRQRFGINVFKVREVIQCPELTQVPHSNPVVRGIANMRGLTIPVMDLCMAIGGPPLNTDANPFVVITEYNRKVQGFLVGSVERIINTNWDDILAPPKGTGKASYMTAVTHVDDELVEIIDVEKVLKEVVGVNEQISDGILQQDLATEDFHVLLADDSLVARKQIEHVLQQMGLGYTSCKNGREALDCLKAWVEEGKDLSSWLIALITDIEMPKMDGYTLASEIRKDPNLKPTYVMMHSSLSGVFNQNMVKSVGADEFIPKYDPDDLAERMQKRVLEHMEKIGVPD